MKKAYAPRKIRQDQETLTFESDETFVYIAGYTSGGAPYGVTWDEWSDLNEETEDQKETEPGRRVEAKFAAGDQLEHDG
jgi:hypothetical protein